MAKKSRHTRLVDKLHQAFALHQQGRMSEASALYEEILRVDPTMPDALHLSGSIALQRGDALEALRRFEKALAKTGPNANFLVSAGNALAMLNRHAEAEDAFRRAIALNPRFAAAYNNLGNLLVRFGRYQEAIGAYDQVVVLDPGHVNALLALGRLLANEDATAPALTLLHRARDVAPDDERVLMELARVHFRARHYAAAMQALDAALRIRPDSVPVLGSIGEILRTTARYSEAADIYRRALAISPYDDDATNGLTLTLNRLGRTAEGVTLIRKQLQHTGGNVAGHSNLLFLLNNLPEVSAHELFLEHKAWNAKYAEVLGQRHARYDQDRDPARRLRIGYVSSDFCAHSVAFFVEPILERHDRNRFEVFAYYNSNRVDRVTHRLKALPITWRDVCGMADHELAELIRSDRIDILVDLNGHTGSNRLLTFARSPAPVQISYLGYPNSTGLTAIQYRISDAIADPPGSGDALSSETLLRLPDCFHCYRPAHGGDPDFSPPSAVNGWISFASFNVLGKLNPLVIAAWARILAAVPESRLLLKTSGLADGGAHARLIEAFAGNGIDASRLVLAGHQDSHAEHMARYRDVDIALDPFPYCGTTTTCDALWMGVPVITLCGDRHAGRVGASLLRAVGLEELVAGTIDDYVRLAVSLAGQPERLAHLHRDLRGRMQSSPLTDEVRFVGNLEKLLREAWHRWCAGSPVGTPVGGDESAATNGRAGPDDASSPPASSAATRRLHIGGKQPRSGWEIMNAVSEPGVDHLGNANDLARFADASFDTLYASHVLEHLDYKDELPRALREWVRVLKPGGELLVSVPDLEVLSTIILDKTLSPSDRFWAMGMIFGGHRDAYDYHHVGLTEEFLRQYLLSAGVGTVERVDSFGLFDDASEITHAGRRISLNVRSRKPTAEIVANQPRDTVGARTRESTRDNEADVLALPHWRLRLAGDVSLCVPSDYSALTPYVLLEQEDWFEEEIGFVRTYLQAGMQVVDIGANYGIYSINAARCVGKTGHVWAFEPVDRTRRFLGASLAANAFDQITIDHRAISDTDGEAWISLNANPELNRLTTSDHGESDRERITVTTLDAWFGQHPEARPDFVKIDAEGHERKILAGGKTLLATSSPLVMFEIKETLSVNGDLIDDFRALGFLVFRLVPGLGLLEGLSPSEDLDPFQLNLFACKPDLAEKLRGAGRLAENTRMATAAIPPYDQDWVDRMASMPCFGRHGENWRNGDAPPHAVRDALVGYLQALRSDLPPSQRIAALRAALDHARQACLSQPCPTRLHTLARIAWMAGQRFMAVQALGEALTLLDRDGEVRFPEPFLPASPRFDEIPIDHPRTWLEAATVERLLQLRSLSGYFVELDAERRLVERAARLPHLAPQMERRRQLVGLRSGVQTLPECTPPLVAHGPNNRNPGFWCR